MGLLEEAHQYHVQYNMYMSMLKEMFSQSQIHRRTGRTQAIARVLLENAIESHQPTFIFDHTISGAGYSNQRVEHVRNCIEDWVKWYREKGVCIKVDWTGYGINTMFTAYRMGHAFNTDGTFDDMYDKYSIRVRDKLFDAEKIKEQIRILERRKLLLLL